MRLHKAVASVNPEHIVEMSPGFAQNCIKCAHSAGFLCLYASRYMSSMISEPEYISLVGAAKDVLLWRRRNKLAKSSV